MVERSWLWEHLNEFNRIVTQLSGLEVKTEEADKSLLFLSSLLPSYEHLVTTLIFGKETLEMDEVTSALISSEMMKINSEKSQDDGHNVASVSNQRRMM
ncbi:hypothetical protein MRB53_017176 [Persea americana]|uniref:Uncharacterized protein n=1 Tax=Persea americana TaxID=3435 RepID=A0ACC2M3Y3_PERAE|nr:hypothetical protein MRB53_017176 [Persea americana]